jgi:hypothetical protein
MESIKIRVVVYFVAALCLLLSALWPQVHTRGATASLGSRTTSLVSIRKGRALTLAFRTMAFHNSTTVSLKCVRLN